MNNNTTEYTAQVEMPDTGETIEIVGISEEDVNQKMQDLFDYGLDTNGTYVGDEADK